MKLDPKRAALLVLDVQNDLVPETAGIRQYRTLDHIAAVLRAARRRKLAVIHVTASVRRDFRDIPSGSPLWIGLRRKKQLILGTRGGAIHPKAKPLPRELVVNKTCVNPFLTTSLGQALHNADVNTVIIAGLWTNYVVEATARHAADVGYRTYVVREACASNDIFNHEFAMNRILPTICYVVGVREVLSALE